MILHIDFIIIVIVSYYLNCSYSYTSVYRSTKRITQRISRYKVNIKDQVSQIEDDGYTLAQGKKHIFSHIQKRLNIFSSGVKPGTLILVRHGESVLNYNKTFTGWIDSDLSERGKIEVEHAARLLLERGYEVDTIYTSRLKRAIKSTWYILREINQLYRPVFKSWRLNERMYGALEGLSKTQTAITMGEEKVQKFRVGLEGKPPPMTKNHPFYHGNERKYADLNINDIPVSESLLDTMLRTIPLWESRILPDLKSGKTVMIVAHANSLRGIIYHIDKLSKQDITNVAIPNGIPLIYKFDKNFNPIKSPNAQLPMSGEFLEKKGLLRTALMKENELMNQLPGMKNENTENSAVIENLNKLLPTSPLMMTNSVKPSVMSNDAKIAGLTKLNIARTLYDDDTLVEKTPIIDDAVINSTNPNRKNSIFNGPVVVITRHGKTEYNKLGIFTGWEDAPLAPEG